MNHSTTDSYSAAGLIMLLIPYFTHGFFMAADQMGASADQTLNTGTNGELIMLGLEYLIGGGCLLLLLTAVIEDILYQDTNCTLMVIASIVALNILMPLFAKGVLVLIFAGVICVILTCLLGPGFLFVFYFFGELGALFGVLFLISTIISSTMYFGW